MEDLFELLIKVVIKSVGFILQSLFGIMAEFFLKIICYGTGRVLIFLSSFGMIKSENLNQNSPIYPKWRKIQRDAKGRVYIEDEMVILIGLIFWMIIVVILLFYFR